MQHPRLTNLSSGYRSCLEAHLLGGVCTCLCVYLSVWQSKQFVSRVRFDNSITVQLQHITWLKHQIHSHQTTPLSPCRQSKILLQPTTKKVHVCHHFRISCHTDAYAWHDFRILHHGIVYAWYLWVGPESSVMRNHTSGMP